MKIELINKTLVNAGKINDHIENPEALKTLSSLFLFSFIYVFIELSKKTVGKIMGNREGIWRIAISTKIPNCIFLLELLLINSIKSIEMNSKHENVKIIINEIKFSFNKYLNMILFFSIKSFQIS